VNCSLIYNVTVLPGSYLAREANGHNPGAGRIRMALVAEKPQNAWKQRSASSNSFGVAALEVPDLEAFSPITTLKKP